MKDRQQTCTRTTFPSFFTLVLLLHTLPRDPQTCARVQALVLKFHTPKHMSIPYGNTANTCHPPPTTKSYPFTNHLNTTSFCLRLSFPIRTHPPTTNLVRWHTLKCLLPQHHLPRVHFLEKGLFDQKTVFFFVFLGVFSTYTVTPVVFKDRIMK